MFSVLIETRTLERERVSERRKKKNKCKNLFFMRKKYTKSLTRILLIIKKHRNRSPISPLLPIRKRKRRIKRRKFNV